MSYLDKLGGSAKRDADNRTAYFIQQRAVADENAITAAFAEMKKTLDGQELQQIVGEHSVTFLKLGVQDRYGVNLDADVPEVKLDTIRAAVSDTEGLNPQDMLYRQFLQRMQGTFDTFKREATNCNDNGYVSKQAVDEAMNGLMERMAQAAVRASQAHERDFIVGML